MSDDDESFLGALSLVGLLSFCCIGLGAVAGGAAIAVMIVALVARWRFN